MSAVVLLTDILVPSRVKIPLEADTKAEVIRELVQVLADAGCVADRDAVLDVVLRREEVLSTGVGHGVALPHGKTDACGTLCIAAGVTTGAVEFQALDAEPVRLFFLLVGPESVPGPHIKALSQISRLVRQADVRERLLEARDAEAFVDSLRRAESG